MWKLVFSAWMIIDAHGADPGQHNYLFRHPTKNYHVAWSQPEPFILPEYVEGAGTPYKENTYIKLYIEADCDTHESQAPNVNHMKLMRQEHICTATKVIELKCTPQNAAFINGRIMC